MLRLLTTLTVAAALLSGCGNRASITGGGRVPGEILTVYTLVGDGQAGTDFGRGAKLALAQAGGHVGELVVQFASAREPADDVEGVATAVRDIVRDTGTIAVIGDLDRRTAAVSAPLLNAVGLLHVSPLSPVTFDQPAKQRTFFAFGATPDAEAEAIVRDARRPIAVETESGSEPLADAVRAKAGRTVATAKARTVVYAGTDPESAQGVVQGILRENPRATVVVPGAIASLKDVGRVRVVAPASGPPRGYTDAFGLDSAPGPYARAGFDAMNAVLAALRRASDPQRRSAVIRAFRPPAATTLSTRG